MRCLLLLLFAFPLRAADPMEVNVDLTEAPRRLYKATLKMAAKPGPLTLHYPKWLQAKHRPFGPITDLTGVRFTAAGKPVEWKRDEVDLYAFHVTVPDGCDSLDASLEYLAPSEPAGDASTPVCTEKLAILRWYYMFLYPLQKGQHVRDIPVKASLKLPAGWKAGGALQVESEKDGFIQYKPCSLETLADSPTICGLHFREFPIGPKNGPPHFLTVTCDSAAGLEVDPKWLADLGKLVEETGPLFGGARHYKSYHLLLTLSDRIPRGGTEHHESSDNRLGERAMIDEASRKTMLGGLFSHEFFHSWDGKHRRPVGVDTPDFQQPMKTDLLWVYEGMTQYYGHVLEARSGLCTPEQTREAFAIIAEGARNQKGRGWRPLEDTATSSSLLFNARPEWASRRRSVDFYNEGLLIWLDVDTLIRERTKNSKSLDDFCKAFFGGAGGAPSVKTYTYEDVIKTLNDVVKNDWKAFLDRRVKAAETAAPLDGIERGGWRLALKPKRSDTQKAREGAAKAILLQSSIGLSANNEGKVIDVIAGTAADKAGVGPGMKIAGVNGRKFTPEYLRDAVAGSAKAKVELIVENGDFLKTLYLDYADGDKFLQLDRDPAKSDLIGEILKPRGQK